MGRSPHTGKPVRTLNHDEDGNAVHIVASDQGGRRGGWGWGYWRKDFPKKRILNLSPSELDSMVINVFCKT